MIRLIAVLGVLSAVLPARAEGYIEYPAPAPLPYTVPTGPVVVIPPYRHAFVMRSYATPPQQPLYNVPPHAAVAPY